MTPPHADEIEVSIFGPGFGEALVVHLGGGHWITVDSCRDLNSDGGNASLNYLDEIGVDPTTAVRLVVLTHWHDDHIGGAGEIIDQCSGARLVLTGALAEKEFRAAISPWLAEPDVELKGLKELSVLTEKIRQLRPILASNNKILLEHQNPFPTEIRALSPSDASILASIARLKGLPPEEWRGTIPKIEGNHTSVVLAIQVGNRRIMLGADLEVRQNSDHGWLAVVESHLNSQRERYTLFKAAHHGSSNGDLDEVWEQMLTPSPHVLLAPFIQGSVKLPMDTDIERILGRSRNAWITARPKGAKLKSYSRGVQREMLGRSNNVEEVPRGCGHVRVRGKIGGDPLSWDVSTFGQATRLDAL